MKNTLRIYLSILGFILLLTTTEYSFSQIKSKPVRNKTVPKPAKFITKSYIGKFTGNPVRLSLEDAKTAVGSFLKIVDNDNFVYELSSYQFAYNRIGVTEDEVTGKVSPTTNLVSDRFSKTPLPESWRTIILEDLQKGEELVFFDIIGIDKSGHKFFAPEIKIIVE